MCGVIIRGEEQYEEHKGFDCRNVMNTGNRDRTQMQMKSTEHEGAVQWFISNRELYKGFQSS